MFTNALGCVRTCKLGLFFHARVYRAVVKFFLRRSHLVIAFCHEERANLQLSIFLTCVSVNVMLMAFVLNALAITADVRRCQIRYACFLCFIDV